MLFVVYHEKLKKIQKEKYENVIKGTYQRPTKFIRKKSAG